MIFTVNDTLIEEEPHPQEKTKITRHDDDDDDGEDTLSTPTSRMYQGIVAIILYTYYDDGHDKCLRYISILFIPSIPPSSSNQSFPSILEGTTTTMRASKREITSSVLL